MDLSRPGIDRSFVQGFGRHAENCRIRRANLAVDEQCLVELKKKPAGSVDLFRRTVDQLEASIRFQKAALAIATSIS